MVEINNLICIHRSSDGLAVPLFVPLRPSLPLSLPSSFPRRSNIQGLGALSNLEYIYSFPNTFADEIFSIFVMVRTGVRNGVVGRWTERQSYHIHP